MIRTSRFVVLSLVVLGSLAVVAPAVLAAPQADVDQPIDLSLRSAELRAVLESFARIAGGELDMSPELEGSVTVELSSVPWKTALHQLCQNNGLSCYWAEAAENRLVVRSANGYSGMAESIDMSLRGAPLTMVLQAMDSIAGEAFRVEVDDAVEGAVDVQLASTPWPEALESLCRTAGCRLTWQAESVRVEPGDSSPATPESDARELLVETPDLEHRIVQMLDRTDAGELPYTELDAFCEEAGCSWTVRWGEPSRLEVRAKKSAESATGPKFGKDPIAFEVSLWSGGFRATRSFAFGWDAPSHRLDPAQEGDGAAVRLTWIPFSAGRQMLLAYTIRCDDSGSARYELRPPIELPLASAWQASFDGGRVEIRNAGATADEGPAAGALCADEPASFQMSLRVDDRAPPPDMPGLPTKPGNYLMVTPRGEPGPAAALVYLGPNSDGSKALALVRPGDAAGSSLERLDLEPGETWSRQVLSEQAGVRMYVTSLP